MSKKNKRILALIAAMLVVFTIMLFTAPKHNYSTKLHTVTEVKNSVAEPGLSQTLLTVSKTGTYVISANWWRDGSVPGFVTGLTIFDESGKDVFSVTGGALFCDSAPMELKNGRYLLRFEVLPTAESYIEYTKEHFPEDEIDEVDESIFTDGVWDMDYSVEISEYSKYGYMLALIAGVAIGLLLVAIAIVAFRKDNAPVKKYDERQIAARGKAYKYGFFTFLGYFVLLMLCHVSGISIPIELPLQIFIGIIISVCVLATIMILKDAYFRLDESQKGWTIFFVMFALLNLGIGIANIVSGSLLKDDVLSFIGSANLLCGIALTYLLIVMLVKHLQDRKEV